MSANLENSAVATGLEKKLVFITFPKKGIAKECSSYCTIVLISHASKVMLKILQAKLPQYTNQELSAVKLELEKGEEPEIKLPIIIRSWRKQGNFKKTSTCASLTRLKPLTVCITTNWKILKEMGIADHLTCVLKNWYASQEATFKTRHGITAQNWESSMIRLYIVTLLI